MAMMSEDPPNDTNGSGTPVTGSTRTTAPMLMTAWPTTHAVMPGGQDAAEAVGGPARHPDPDHRQGHEQPNE